MFRNSQSAQTYLDMARADWPEVSARLFVASAPAPSTNYYITYLSDMMMGSLVPLILLKLFVMRHEFPSEYAGRIMTESFFSYRERKNPSRAIHLDDALAGVPIIEGLAGFVDGRFVPDPMNRTILMSDYRIDPVLFDLDIPQLNAYLTELNQADL